MIDMENNNSILDPEGTQAELHPNNGRELKGDRTFDPIEVPYEKHGISDSERNNDKSDGYAEEQRSWQGGE